MNYMDIVQKKFPTLAPALMLPFLSITTSSKISHLVYHKQENQRHPAYLVAIVVRAFDLGGTDPS